jgi:hypothetical protein
MKKLTLEVNDNFKPSKDTLRIGGNAIVMITPDINEKYWTVRVKLNKKGQAIVGFPKFGLTGIGFAQESDWNTNLPSSCTAVQIYDHIKCNKGYKSIKRADCIAAISMIQHFIHINNL